MKNGKNLRILLVVDASGFIIERIGRTIKKYTHGVKHDIISSNERRNYLFFYKKISCYDAIHWLYPFEFFNYAQQVKLPQILMIHHITDDEIARYYKYFKFCDAITTPSKSWQIKIGNYTSCPIFHVPLSIDSSIFVPSSNSIKLKKKEGFEKQDFVIGFVGRRSSNHSGRKGIDLLLDIITKANHNFKNICLLIIGPGWQDLVIKVRKIGMKVINMEFENSEETSKAYRLMDILLVTSTIEGGPVTILEAMSCGIPVISSKVGHVPEIIQDGITGFIVKSRDSHEYINKIKILYYNKCIRTQIANKAREYIMNERDHNKIIPKIDFDTIYSLAIENYNKRSKNEWILRNLKIPFSYSKYLIRRITK